MAKPHDPDTSQPGAETPTHIEQTLAAINRLHDRHHRSASPLQRVVEAVTAAVGRAMFVGILFGLLVIWIAANLILPAYGIRPFDPAPFELLQATAGVLALFLAVFILATQRRENVLTELRLQLMLELALLSEQRSAKVIALLEELRVDLPSVPNRSDPEAEALASPGDPDALLDALLETTIDSVTDSEPDPP